MTMNDDALLTPSKKIASILARASRPPTPPKETEQFVEDAARFLRGDDDIAPVHTRIQEPRILVDTPPSSSPRPPLYSISSKVRFLDDPTFYRSSAFPDLAEPRPIRIRSPAKSILKTCNTQLATPDEQDRQCGYFTCVESSDFPIMLSQALQALKTTSRSAHLDAYLSINGAFALYNDVPEIDLFRRNMSTMQEMLQRDIVFTQPASREDVNIIIQVIKLTARIVSHESLVKSASLEYQATVLEQCTSALGQIEFPKQGLKFYIGLLAQQRFSQSIWSSFRVEKLITVLQTVEARCGSKSVITTRLEVYKRLIDSTPDMMLKSMKYWLSQTMHGLLSDDNSTRMSALSLFDGTAKIFGSNRTAIRTLHALFDIKTETGVYSEHFLTSLTRFLKDESTKTYVPQIFAAIVLFHRHRQLPIQQWQRWKAWLLIMSKCFKSVDIESLRCSHIAWRKVVYVVRPDTTITDEMWNVLQMPIGYGLRKMGSESKQHRRIALDSYYNLLHYALRPELGFEALDRAWGKAVAPTLHRMVNGNHKGRNTACSILHGLLTSNAGSWNVDAALQVDEFSPADLPKLDSRWVRSRIDLFTSLFDAIFAEAIFADDISFDLASSVWIAMLKNVADAGTQEIKLSTDFKSAVRHILAVLHKRWSVFVVPGYKQYSTSIYDRFDILLTATVEHLMLHKLTDPIIDLSADGTLILLSSVTDNELDKSRTSVTPLVFALLLRSAEPKHINSSATNKNSISSLLTLNIDGLATSSSKILRLSHVFEALQNLLRADSCWDQLSMLWAQVTIQIIAVLGESQSEQWSLSREQDVMNCRKVLAAGLSLPATRYDISMSVVRLAVSIIDAEQAGRERSKFHAYALTDSIARELYKMRREADDERLSSFASAVALLLKNFKWSTTSDSLVEVLRSETPPDDTSGKVSSNMLQLASHTSAAVYAATSRGELMIDPLEMLQDITRVTLECPDSQLRDVLSQYHTAVTIWIKDDDQIVQNLELEHLALELPKIWSQWLETVNRVKALGSSITSGIATMLAIGSGCKMTSIVDMTNMISKAKLSRTINAPASETLRERLERAASESNNSAHENERSRIVQATTQSKNVSPTIEKQLHTQSSTTAQRINMTIHDIAKKSATTAPKKPPRLRHDDSQVEFVAVGPKQAANEAESQHLTDHQQEIRSRQAVVARMYPDASSSPLAIAPSSPTKRQGATFSDAIENLDTFYDVEQELPDSSPSRMERSVLNADETSSPMKGKISVKMTRSMLRESQTIPDVGEHIDEHNASLASATKRTHAETEDENQDDLPLPVSQVDAEPASKRQRMASSQPIILPSASALGQSFINDSQESERDSTPGSNLGHSQQKRKRTRVRKDRDPVIRHADLAVADGEMDDELRIVKRSKTSSASPNKSSNTSSKAKEGSVQRKASRDMGTTLSTARLSMPNPLIDTATLSKKMAKRPSFPNLRGRVNSISQPTQSTSSESESSPSKKVGFENLKNQLGRRSQLGQNASTMMKRGNTADLAIEIDEAEQNDLQPPQEILAAREDRHTIIPQTIERNGSAAQPSSTEEDQIVAHSVEDTHVAANDNDRLDQADEPNIEYDGLTEPRSSFVRDSMESIVHAEKPEQSTDLDMIEQTAQQDLIDDVAVHETALPTAAVSNQMHENQTESAAAGQTNDDDAKPAITSMLEHLKAALEISKTLNLDASDERSVDDMLFVLRQANHEAGRRGRESS